VGQDRYSLVLLVTRSGRAVAHRRLGPSSSATTSTTERALPSSAVQARCRSRPTTTTRLPLVSDWTACSAWSRHTITVKNEVSWSRRPETATPERRPGHAAAAGATTKELMERMGHTSPAVALRYQHVMADRQAAIAAALDGLVRDAQQADRRRRRARGGHDGARRGSGGRAAGR
jgi:3,4-dihydroxy-2-butanone 4-phosphate synthase